jgi:hypothetical protein
MFCTNCGSQVISNANFCAKCGTRIEGKPETQPVNTPVSSDHVFRVSLQGFTADLSAANGSYDPVEKGNLNGEQLKNLLTLVKQASPYQPRSVSEDYCPASLTVFAGEDLFAFEISGGNIIFSNQQITVSVDEAVKICSGKTNTDNTEKPAADTKEKTAKTTSLWESGHKDIKGLSPVRKKHIPPTDRVNTEAATIKYKGSPGINEKVLKSGISGKQYIVPLLFGILAVILMLAGFSMQEPGMGIVSLLVAVALFLLTGYIKGRARGILYMGFDWTTNTIWTLFPGEKLSWLGNANCITGFSIEKSQFTSSRIQNIGSSGTRIYTTVNDKTNLYSVMAQKTDGSNIAVCKLYSEKDAVNVLNKINSLLRQQND